MRLWAKQAQTQQNMPKQKQIAPNDPKQEQTKPNSKQATSYDFSALRARNTVSLRLAKKQAGGANFRHAKYARHMKRTRVVAPGLSNSNHAV
jgi:hypothetical protein